MSCHCVRQCRSFWSLLDDGIILEAKEGRRRHTREWFASTAAHAERARRSVSCQRCCCCCCQQPRTCPTILYNTISVLTTASVLRIRLKSTARDPFIRPTLLPLLERPPAPWRLLQLAMPPGIASVSLVRHLLLHCNDISVRQWKGTWLSKPTDFLDSECMRPSELRA